VWQSPDDPNERAEVRVAITPAFTGFSEVAGDEADFVREFALTGQQTTYSGRASTRVRLVEAVELDGKLVTAKEAGGNGRKAVEFTLDATSSSLVVSFARFHTSAVYDPGTPPLTPPAFFATLPLAHNRKIKACTDDNSHRQIWGCC
jgi:hypothetical protein